MQRRRSVRCCLLAGVITLTLAAGASARTAAERGAPAAVAARTVVVGYASRAELAAAVRRTDARLVRLIPQVHVAELAPGGPTSALVRALGAARGIRYVRLAVARAAADAVPAFSAMPSPAAGPAAWQTAATGLDRVPAAALVAARQITVGVVDTGADVRAPVLAGRIRAAYDVGTASSRVDDTSGHGTFVSSLVAGNGAGGVSGFGGTSRLLVVKAAARTTFSDLDVAAGIVYAVRHGAKIINLSIAGRVASPVETSALEFALARGVLVVAAAGNDGAGGDPPEYPAAVVSALAARSRGAALVVGASDASGSRAPFSESGAFLSLSAPGVDVLGAIPSGLYGLGSGTSFATPEVAGAAALVWASDPRLTAKQVARILEQTASGHGSWNSELGYGVLDVAAAVERALHPV